jgi:hypothetical protein
VYTALFDFPGAAAPKPTLSACATLASFVHVTPESLECHNPYVPEVEPPASHRSPSAPGTAWKYAPPLVPFGRFEAAVAVNVFPPSVLTANVPVA